MPLAFQSSPSPSSFMSKSHDATAPSTNIGPEHEKDPFVPALIVIDMQHDFVYGSLKVPGAASIIDPINSLIDLPFTMKVATRDFHPDNHISFAQSHHKSEFSKQTIYHPEDTEETLGVEQILWPIHCVAYTGGADFVAGLHMSKFDVVVHKGTHPRIESYSAFRDIWAKSLTELPALLKGQGITDLYFAGVAGDYCVKYTALDAVDFGYKTWLIKDAVKSISEDLAMKELADKGVQFTTIKEVKELLAPNARTRFIPSEVRSPYRCSLSDILTA